MAKIDKPDEIGFAAKLSELEAITSWFESSEVDLSEALVKFERGMELASELKEHLQVTQNKVEKIKRRFDAPVKSDLVLVEDPVVEEDLGEEPDSLDLFGSK